MLLGNLYYAWQCGRLGNKEDRTDVTAQPYVNTTGVYITLYAINLEALISAGFLFLPAAGATDADIRTAAVNAADHAWKVSVAANFLLGIFEMLGAFFGESIRKAAPAAAFYAPMVGVGFVYLGFVPMLNIAAEPMVCLIPLLIVFNGFFGGVRYHIFRKLTFPIGLLAILAADGPEVAPVRAARLVPQITDTRCNTLTPQRSLHWHFTDRSPARMGHLRFPSQCAFRCGLCRPWCVLSDWQLHHHTVLGGSGGLRGDHELRGERLGSRR